MNPKKVLIVDENGFARVCSALLELNGHPAVCLCEGGQVCSAVDSSDIGLVVTSYPYGAKVFEAMHDSELPLLVLVDSMSEDLLRAIDKIKNLYCMVKPLDYEKFRLFVDQALAGNVFSQGGCRFV